MGSKNESCLAVFSNLGSPFLETSGLRHHYHPSQTQPLKQEKQYAVLSPPRLLHEAYPTFPKQGTTQSPASLSLPSDSIAHEANPSKSESASSFNESWPSTERSSSSLTPEGTKNLLSERFGETEASLKPQNSTSGSDSVIARYIERFRHGQPTNPKERWTPGGQSDRFWWLGHSPPSECNASKKDSSPSSVSNQSEATSSSSVFMGGSPSGESQDNSSLDQETISLQDRATKLLQRSTSPLSSSRHVSSEGIASTPVSTTTDSVGMVGHNLHHLTAQQCQGSLSAVPCDVTRTHFSKPEDDILFQWRLRRKMEEASKSVAFMPPLAWRSPCFYPPCAAGGLVEGAALRSPEPVNQRSECAALPTSEPWLDARCIVDKQDPCCCVNCKRCGIDSRHLEGSALRHRTVAVECCEPKKEEERKDPVPQKNPASSYADSPFPLASTENINLSHRALHQAHQTARPVQKECRESTGSQKTFKSKKDQARAVRNSREQPVTLTNPSIQRILGEVVAERLFSPSASSSPHKEKTARRSKDQRPQKTLQDAVAISSHPQLLDKAAQLLEQAEESDGTEFEDDPLLQVLRSQRELLRSKLRAVEIQMAELANCHQD